MKNQKLEQKLDNETIGLLERLTLRAHYYAMQMIDIANHKREHDRTDPKTGGHPAASASALHILGALHLWVKQASDHIAVKPHASPADHSYNYMLRNLFKHETAAGPAGGTVERLSDEDMKTAMHGLRKFSKDGEPVFQSYHSAWDPDGLNFFPSGSVGIPPVMAAYLAHSYRFAEEHGYDVPKNAHFWSVIGDSEFREGSIYEAMPDAAEREIGTLTWIVDYNRQSLDGHRITNREIMEGTDDERIERTAAANGWEVIQVRHGKKRVAAFSKKDGDLFKGILENGFDDYEYQSLLRLRDGKAIREDFLKKEPKLKNFLADYDDKALVDLFIDLGGHDIGALIEAMQQSKVNKKKPTLIIAHTVKGWHLDCMAVSGNHSTLPDDKEIQRLREAQGVPADEPFQRFGASTKEGQFLKERGDLLHRGYQEQIAIRDWNRKQFKAKIDKTNSIPEAMGINLKMVPIVHTQWMLGQLAAKMTRIANTPGDPAKLKPGQKVLTAEEERWKVPSELLVTMAPDVGTSTNLNPTMDGKIFGPENVEDFETEYKVKDTKSPDIVPGEEVSHRHLRFEIAEGNAMSCVGAYGKMRDITGVPLIPLMTVYDFFIKRALDQFFYNLYWNSSFILVGTPSGISLSPEGAQHGWKSDIQIPNMITWEPVYGVELDWIVTESIRLHLEYRNEGRTGVLIRATTRGMEQSEMLKRLKRQVRFKTDPNAVLAATTHSNGAIEETQVAAVSDEQILSAIRSECLSGGYFLVDYRGYTGYEPGDNVVNIFTMGTLTTEALKASDELLQKGIYANVVVVSSTDLLIGNLAAENDYHHLRKVLNINGDLHLVPQLNGDANTADVVTLAGRRVPIVSVHDGEPGLLDNLGGLVGVRQEVLATRHHSKSGRPVDIYKYHHMDFASVVEACGKVLAETALEKISLSRKTAEHALNQTHENAGQQWQELWPH